MLGAVAPAGIALCAVSLLAGWLNGVVMGLILLCLGLLVRARLAAGLLDKPAEHEFENRITCKLDTARQFVRENPDLQLSVALVNKPYRQYLCGFRGVAPLLHSMFRLMKTAPTDMQITH